MNINEAIFIACQRIVLFFNTLWPAALGQLTKSGSISVVPAIDWYQPNTDDLISLGLVTGWAGAQRSGLNTDIDSAADEELWSAPSYGGPAIRAIPTVAQVHTFVSASANDTAAGTGCRAIRFEYVDSSGALASSIVATNGTTPVTLPSMLLLHTAQGVSFGSLGTSAGNITVTASVDGTTQAILAAGMPISHLSAFMIPAGYTGLFSGATGSFVNSAAGSLANIRMEINLYGSGGWVSVARIPMRSEAGSSVPIFFNPPYAIPERTVIRFIGSSPTNNNSQLGVTYALKMRAN